MEIKKVLFRKEMKLVTLLLTSLLIASASAAVYYSLTWQPRVTTTALSVQFSTGDDTPAGSTVNPSWARLLLKSYPNATLTYDEPLNITNSDTAAHSMRLRHVTITPANGNADVGNFTRIKFYLIAQNGTQITTFEYTTTGNNWNTPATTSYYSVPASQKWVLKAETLSPATASTSIQANIQISLDVQE